MQDFFLPETIPQTTEPNQNRSRPMNHLHHDHGGLMSWSCFFVQNPSIPLRNLRGFFVTSLYEIFNSFKIKDQILFLPSKRLGLFAHLEREFTHRGLLLQSISLIYELHNTKSSLIIFTQKTPLCLLNICSLWRFSLQRFLSTWYWFLLSFHFLQIAFASLNTISKTQY